MWTEEITRFVLILWGEEKSRERTQQGNKKHYHRYKRILKKVEEKFGVTFTSLQITNKLKSLRRQYTAAKVHNNNNNSKSTGPTFPYCDLLDNLLGDSVMEGGRQLGGDDQHLDESSSESEEEETDFSDEGNTESEIDEESEVPVTGGNEVKPLTGRQAVADEPKRKRGKTTKLVEECLTNFFNAMTKRYEERDGRFSDHMERMASREREWLEEIRQIVERGIGEQHERMREEHERMREQQETMMEQQDRMVDLFRVFMRQYQASQHSQSLSLPHSSLDQRRPDSSHPPHPSLPSSDT